MTVEAANLFWTGDMIHPVARNVRGVSLLARISIPPPVGDEARRAAIEGCLTDDASHLATLGMGDQLLEEGSRVARRVLERNIEACEQRVFVLARSRRSWREERSLRRGLLVTVHRRQGSRLPAEP